MKIGKNMRLFTLLSNLQYQQEEEVFMNKYERLRNRIENMVNEIDIVIADMQNDVHNRNNISKDIYNSNEQLLILSMI